MDVNLDTINYRWEIGVLEYQRIIQISKTYTRSLIFQSLLLAALIPLYVVARSDNCKFGGHYFILLTLLIKGVVIIPALVIIRALVSYRKLTFFQIEIITILLIIPLVAWHSVVIIRFFGNK